MNTIKTDLSAVNRLKGSHRFRWVGDVLHITDGTGAWEYVVDRSRPISMGASGATLPMIQPSGDHCSTPVACNHALLYAATFGMRIFTNTSGDFTVEGPTQ